MWVVWGLPMRTGELQTFWNWSNNGPTQAFLECVWLAIKLRNWRLRPLILSTVASVHKYWYSAYDLNYSYGDLSGQDNDLRWRRGVPGGQRISTPLAHNTICAEMAKDLKLVSLNCQSFHTIRNVVNAGTCLLVRVR